MTVSSRSRLASAKRVVVKIGTNALTNRSGRFDADHFARLAGILVDVAKHREVLVVSSGAIALGVERLRLNRRPKDIAGKQACAAVGQSRLMHAWEQALAPRVVAQVLLTHSDVQDRKRYLNARYALERLLRHRVIPVINENDTVSVDEIKFGDNDTLAGVVCGLVSAQALVILSDVDGLYDADPRVNQGAKLLVEVPVIDAAIRAMGGHSRSAVGTGGMATKLKAAELATATGACCVIAPGHRPELLERLFEGAEVGTLFLPHHTGEGAKRRWIGHALRPKGTLVVDEGAFEAVSLKKRSLLPAGIVKVVGKFGTGDLVELCFGEHVFGRGLVTYSAKELVKVMGKRTGDLEPLLGFQGPAEAVHRDNLVLHLDERQPW